MKITVHRIITLWIPTLIALLLLGCSSSTTNLVGITVTPGGPTTRAPVILEAPNPAYSNAQATLDSGKSQLLELSRKSTEVGLNMSQAANAAALSTQDYNRRQKMDLDYQATVISMNIAQAAATQKYILQQTKIAGDATGAAQKIAAAATQSAYLIHVTQTAHAQGILEAQDVQTSQAIAALTAYPLTATVSAQLMLDAQAAQAAQAMAALTAYPLTATPFAVTQAAVLMQQYDREQKSFVNLVVRPMIPILAILDLLLFILGVIWAYRRLMPMPWPRHLRMTSTNLNPTPLIMIDGVMVDPHPRLHSSIPAELTQVDPPMLPGEKKTHIEIVNATEPPFAHWITEVEQQLDAERRLQL